MRLAALDTKFLLAFAGGESDAAETFEYLHSRGFTPIITASVIEQLGELRQDKTNPAYEYAKEVYWMIPQWGVIEIPNPNVENGTSCAHAEKFRDRGLIPEATRIEAEILIEASLCGCVLLITFSNALLEAQTAPLNFALIENGMDAVAVAIASPSMIAERLRLDTRASPPSLSP